MAIVDFADQIESRDGTLLRDARNVNAFAEATPEGMAMVKRPGLALQQVLPAGTAQGMLNLSGQGWGITGNTLRNLTTPATTVAIAAAGSDSLVFDVLSDFAANGSLLRNSNGLWVFNGTTATKVTDPDYPAATLPGLCELDGTYYVMNAANSYICGSAVKDPTTWDALNFIGPSSQLGTGVAVHRHLNYIIGFYTEGMQVYYDAANATGSPLSPAGNASWRTGCASGDSIVELNDLCFFLSQTAANGRAVTCIEGLQPGIVSTPFVEKILAKMDLTGLRALALRLVGHPFYLLSFPANGITLAYDALMKRWDLWSSVVGGVETAFSGCNYLHSAGLDLLQDASSGVVYRVDPTAMMDVASPINVWLRTRNQSWKTHSRKFFGQGLLHADTISSSLQERHSDDDFQSWSGWRTIDLSTDKKMLQRNGSARRRAFELFHADASPLRVWGLEFELEKGAD